MAELMASIILISCLIGMGVIIIRKIPVLISLPLPETANVERTVLSLRFNRLKERILNSLSLIKFLEKILLKIKILTLKFENKTSFWLDSLRRRSKKQKNNSDDNYWDELKKAKNRGC